MPTKRAAAFTWRWSGPDVALQRDVEAAASAAGMKIQPWMKMIIRQHLNGGGVIQTLLDEVLPVRIARFERAIEAQRPGDGALGPGHGYWVAVAVEEAVAVMRGAQEFEKTGRVSAPLRAAVDAQRGRGQAVSTLTNEAEENL